MTIEWRTATQAFLKSEYAQLAGYALTTAIACAGVYYAWRAYSLFKSSIEKQPELELAIFGFPAPDTLIYILPFKDRNAFWVPLQIVVSNYGGASAKSVDVSFEFPDEIYQRDGERELSKIALAKGIRFADQQGQSKPTSAAFLGSVELVPKSAWDLRLKLLARSATRVDVSGIYPAKNDEKVELVAYLECAWPVSISITASDLPPMTVALHVAYLSCPDHFLDSAKQELKPEALLAVLGDIQKKKTYTVVVCKEFNDTTIEVDGKRHTIRDGLLESIAVARIQAPEV